VPPPSYVHERILKLERFLNFFQDKTPSLTCSLSPFALGMGGNSLRESLCQGRPTVPIFSLFLSASLPSLSLSSVHFTRQLRL